MVKSRNKKNENVYTSAKQMAKSSKTQDNNMTMISLRLSKEMVAELKRIAPLVGISGYQPLIRSYIEQGISAQAKAAEKEAQVEELSEENDDLNADGERPTNQLAEVRTEYIVERPTAFIAGEPLEWRTAVETKKNWGANVIDLLKTLDLSDWADDTHDDAQISSDDAVAWVDKMRTDRNKKRDLFS